MSSVLRELLRRLDTAVSKEGPAVAVRRLAEAAAHLLREEVPVPQKPARVLQACVNRAAITNSCADAYVSPFPQMPRKQH